MSKRDTIFLPAEYALTVEAGSGATGYVAEISPGIQSSVFTAIAASTTTIFGPFNEPKQYEIVSSLGELTSSSAKADVQEGLTSSAAELNILDGATTTAAELNLMDVSAQAETIDSGVAVSVLILNTKIDNTSGGAGAVTLAVPGAGMYGKVKTVEMIVDGGDTTLALTNVVGGSAATTCTFAAVNDCLVLIGGTNKWHVIAESGVVLS